MKVNNLILLIGLFLHTLSASDLSSQISLEWARFFYSNNSPAKSLCLDDSLNIFITGGQHVNKYNQSGILQWNFVYPYNNNAFKLLYNSGFIFSASKLALIRFTNPDNITMIRNGKFTGVHKGTDKNIYGVVDDGSGNIYFEKYDSIGSLIWSRIKQRGFNNTYGSVNSFLGINNSINVFGISNLVFSGHYYSDPIYISYNSNGDLIMSQSGSNAFPNYYLGIGNNFSGKNVLGGLNSYSIWQTDFILSDLDSLYNIQNSYVYNGSGNSRDEVWDIETDEQGNLYVAAKSWGVSVNYDFVVLKFNSDIQLLWEYRFNGSENALDEAKNVEVDNSGNVYATGNVTMNNHGIQIYTVKLSPDGQLIWSDKFSRYNSIIDTNSVNDLKIDDNGNIYLCGMSRDSSLRRTDYLTVKYSNTTSIQNNEQTSVLDYSVIQNYPNPFNPVTNIDFTVPKNSLVKIEVYSSQGKRIAELTNSEFTAGKHSIKWNAEGFSTGIYFIRFQTDQYNIIKKAVLIK